MFALLYPQNGGRTCRGSSKKRDPIGDWPGEKHILIIEGLVEMNSGSRFLSLVIAFLERGGEDNPVEVHYGIQ